MERFNRVNVISWKKKRFYGYDKKELRRYTIQKLNENKFLKILSGRFRGQHNQTMKRVTNKISMKLSIISTSSHNCSDLVLFLFLDEDQSSTHPSIKIAFPTDPVLYNID